MRILRTILTSVALLIAPTLVAAAAPFALMQDAQPQVDVDIKTDGGDAWYTNPLWLAIGAIIVLLVIVLAIAAGRSGGGSSTTVVR